MKKIYIALLINCLFSNVLVGQTLMQQIENAYSTLDSTSYIEDVIQSYKEEVNLARVNTSKMDLDYIYSLLCENSVLRQNMLDSIMRKYNTRELSYKEDLTKDKVWKKINAAYTKQIENAHANLDGSIKLQNIYDSITIDFEKVSMERDYSLFISSLKDRSFHFVLNLIVKKDSLNDEKIFFEVDTTKLNFNILGFGKNYKGGLYILYEDGVYSAWGSPYRAYTPKTEKNAPKVFKKIMQKNPQYLLYCNQFEGLNTILYVLNNKIYVYRIIQMEEYELCDYIRKIAKQGIGLK